MPVTPWSADAPFDLEERVGELLGRTPGPPLEALIAELATFCDHHQSPVAYIDRSLHYRYVNPAYERIIGRPRGVLLKQTFIAQLSDQGFERLKGTLKKVLAGEATTLEASFRTRAGDVRPLRRYLPHRGPSGEVEGMIVVGGRSERNRAMVDRLTLLHALSTALTLAENSEARSDFLLVHCMDFLGAEGGAVAMLEPDRGPGLWVTAHLGHLEGLPRVGERMLDGCPLMSRAFDDRWPQVERDEAGWVKAVALPLEIDGRSIGVLVCALPPDAWLDDEDRSVLLALAEQGAQAFERARLLDSERRARANAEAAVSRLRFLTAASRSMALAPLEPVAVMDEFCASLVKGGALFCAVHVLDPDTRMLEPFALDHRELRLAELLRTRMDMQIPLQGTLPGEAIRARSALLHPELDPPFWGAAGAVLEEVFGEEETGQLLVVPLSLKQRTLGVVSVLFGEPNRPLDAEDVSLIQKVGDRAIIAFEAARAFEAERRALERSEAVRHHLERMHELSEALTGAVTPDSVMRVLAERGREVLDASESVAVLPDLDRGTLRWVSISTRSGRCDPQEPDFPWDAWHPVAVAFRRGDPLFLEGHENLRAQFPQMPMEPYVTEPTTVLAVMPLRTHQGVLGVLAFRFTDSHPLVNEDRVFLRDLTRQGSLALERAGLYEAQAVAVGDRDEFLSIASHELRTPLTPLHLKLELLDREITERVTQDQQERLKAHVQVMRRQVRRMGELINGMLDLSRIDSGLLPLEPTEFELPELIREVVQRHQEEMAQAGCTLTLRFEGEGRGRWDRNRIEQVVTNLLTNAFKYGAGRPIEIRFGEDPANVWFEVEDHGIGIAEKEVPRLFQRFARAVSERNYGGLGLGLYITRRIVESHGGSVQVASFQGRGSVFRTQLPKWFLPEEKSRPTSPPDHSQENA